MKITLLQQDISWGNPETNVRNAEQAMEACPGSDVYVLPEMFSTGTVIRCAGCAAMPQGTIVPWPVAWPYRKAESIIIVSIS